MRPGFDKAIYNETTYYIRNGMYSNFSRPFLLSHAGCTGYFDGVVSLTSLPLLTGFRYVKPYYFTFTTHAKGRWVGLKVIDVFSREFQAETPQFYVRSTLYFVPSLLLGD